MNEEERQALESLRKNRGVSFEQADIISNLINKQQKEIEELKKENFDTVYIQAIENYKDKIRKIIYGNYEDLEIILLIKELLEE